MLATYDDWLEVQRRKREEKRREQIPRLEMLQQAGVRAEFLTGDPTWDIYLQFLSGTIERAKAIKAEYERQLADPMIVNDDEMRGIKIKVIECSAAIRAFEAALELPATLMKNGETAKDIITSIGLQDESVSDGGS